MKGVAPEHENVKKKSRSVPKRDGSAFTSPKVPPHNLEAEQAVLGGLLINSDAMNQVVDILSPQDFYREAHATIFDGMVQLYNDGEPIDFVTLSEALKKRNN